MKRGEVVITYVELIMGAVILILAGLLIISYVTRPDCELAAEPTQTAPEPAQTAPEPQEPENETVDVEPEPSCDDGEQNQDETDVDCGGSCEPCADGQECISDDDCASDDCTGGECIPEPELSGEVTFDFTRVGYTEQENGAIYVDRVEVAAENGLEEDIDVELRIFLKTSTGSFYLNQLLDDELDEDYKPYAVVPIGMFTSGGTLDREYELEDWYEAGKYLYSATDHYDTGDDFLVEVRLADRASGEVYATDERIVRP